MTDTFRALCAELANHLQGRKELECGWGEEDPEQDLLDRARAALAQPEPKGLTNEELEKLADDYMFMDGADGTMHLEHIDFARAAIAADRARWGCPAIEPVPVSERLPEPQDCDVEGRCWWAANDGIYDHWRKLDLDKALNTPWRPTHWLPHHALPLPTAH